jgi:phosphorylase kinase alpha/beta subunit
VTYSFSSSIPFHGDPVFESTEAYHRTIFGETSVGRGVGALSPAGGLRYKLAMLRVHNLRLLDYLRHSYTADDVRRLGEFLRQQGTFAFPALANGLFPAAHVAADDLSGYAGVWVRDNAHVAYALHLDGQTGAAVKAVTGLARFLATQERRIADVLAGRADPNEPMNRPHIRFDGRGPAEIDQRWAHAQNDALGYFLWITAKLLDDGALGASDELGRVLAATVLFLEKIEFWRDEDSGHWEETRKRSASSIGAATAGLAALRRLLDRPEIAGRLLLGDRHVTAAELDRLLRHGRESLLEHLGHAEAPHESLDAAAHKFRRADAALLFLVYPLEVVDDLTAARVMEFVVRELAGDIGIRRYRGDSYWCADYKDKLAAEVRSADFSDDLSSRNSLLRDGEEAQWCIFDPVLSSAYGRRYQQARDPQTLAAQTWYFNRSLAHLTGDDSRFGGLRCPESYYLEKGRYVPVDQTPLLWTQANLLVALRMMERSLGGA